MTPQGYPSPPFVGPCIRCGNPVFGAYIALPGGPAHPACAQAPGPPQAGPPQRKAPIGVIVGGVIVLIMAIFVFRWMVQSMNDDYAEQQAKEAEAKALEAETRAKQAAASIPKERPAFLYCDPQKVHCPTLQEPVKLYATPSDYTARNGVFCKGGKKLCIQPSTPSMVAAANTRATILPEEADRFAFVVRIEEGPNKGKKGYVEDAFVHDAPRP